jgi:hypothetical protein
MRRSSRKAEPCLPMPKARFANSGASPLERLLGSFLGERIAITFKATHWRGLSTNLAPQAT